jgi:hypothetical protein
MLLHFSDLANIQIHNYVYSPVGNYFEKTGYKHKCHKLYFTQQQRTDNNALVFNCCIFITLWRGILKIPQVLEFTEFLTVRNQSLFYSVQEG